MDWQGSPNPKRRRIDDDVDRQASFTNAQQISQALSFQSSISPDAKASINKFKDFLSGINKVDDVLEQQKRLQTLKTYCDLQAATSREQVDFPDLLATWSSAVETKNDPLASLIPAVLAQFFRAISGVLEFREFGLSLCYTLLKRDQRRLLDRGLSSPRTKEHLISPCLRLLNEMTSFDGGTMANRVFQHHDILFRRLESLLDAPQTDRDDDTRRPTVRRMALRLIISNLKFLDVHTKPEFLAQNRLFRSLAVGLTYDGDDIILDIIKAINTGVIDDVEIPRSSKVKFFSSDFLSSIAALYSYEPNARYPDSASNVREAIHGLLLKTCTSSRGVCLQQNGWYPMGYDLAHHTSQDESQIDLGLESPLYFDDYSSRLPVRNATLAAFTRSLHPDTDVLQAELLTKMFNYIPELVAEYFTRNLKLSISADDDTQWRGRFAFLFSVVQAPVPKNLGWREGIPEFPPPISIVIESILPKPLKHVTLTRFFTLKNEMLVLSGSRLLSIALRKLGRVLNFFQNRQTAGILWSQAYRKLVEMMLDRVPQYKELTEAYHRCGKGNTVLITALFECIAMYHQLLPEAVMSSKFDVGPLLLDSIRQIAAREAAQEIVDDVLEQISWLTIVARSSPVTKWWSKAGADELTLFTSLLGFMIANEDFKAYLEISNTVKVVAESSGIFGDLSLSFEALLQSLRRSKSFEASDILYGFIDNSIHRAIQKPVKYLNIIEREQQLASDKTSLSILACAVAEQWTIVLKKHQGHKHVFKDISKWIARYFSAIDGVGENFRVLMQFKDDMMQSADEKSKDYLEHAFEKLFKNPIELQPHTSSQESNAEQDPHTNDGEAKMPEESSKKLDDVLDKPVMPVTSLEDVDRWDGKTDIGYAVQSGRMAKLIRCTSSPDTEIRVQAFHLLQKLAHVVDESSYPEKSQLHLLLGELCETIRQHGFPAQIPSVIAELGVKLLYIITNPAHKLFGKANKFLLRGPSWEIKRLIPHWTDRILFTEPEADEPSAWTEDVEWYVSWLADGLKNNEDMEFYRRSGVFEKLLALYSSPAVLRTTRKQILTILWRAIAAGGADTLITRVGLNQWLKVAAITDNHHADIIRMLAKCLDEASDKDVINAWKDAYPLLKGTE